MSGTHEFYKIELFNYNTDDNQIQNNSLTYNMGPVDGPTIGDAINQTPTATGNIIAGGFGEVPKTSAGQHSEFGADPASEIATAVSALQVGHSTDFNSQPITNLIIGLGTGNSFPYAGVINIWDSTVSPYVIWGSFSPTISSTGTTVIPLLNDPSYDGNNATYKPMVYRNVDGTASGINIDFEGTVPTTSLPESFVIELEDGENTMDYLAMSVTNNCLAEDSLVEKMVEQ